MVIGLYNTAFLLSFCRWSPVEPVETAPVDVRRSSPAVESAGWAGGTYSAEPLQRDRATRYVRKFVLFHEVRELKRFQTAKVTFKVIQGYLQQRHTISR